MKEDMKKCNCESPKEQGVYGPLWIERKIII